MADTTFSDEWLAHSLEGVVTPELVAELREKAAPQATLWETLVAQKVVNDEQILTALSTRFRLKIAELDKADPTAKERVPEQVARRYRIVGVLRQVMKIPRQAGLPLISRIKIMSSLDIADRLRPQDGRARVAVNGQPIDLRVSTLPAALGEKIVIRILDSRATVKSLESLGLNSNETEGIKRLLENHEGILLVTGPTGSGKTTTLYSCINQIKSEGVNIVTVEDPVEYRMQGIVQVQVQE